MSEPRRFLGHYKMKKENVDPLKYLACILAVRAANIFILGSTMFTITLL